MFISGILLAAGSSTRMGADKLLLPYQGRRLIDRALAALVDCPLINEVLIVVRPDFPPPWEGDPREGEAPAEPSSAWEGEAPAEPPSAREAEAPAEPLLAAHPKCRLVVNPDHRQGMGTSLRTGVQAANPAADAYVLSLADMPEITSDIVAALIDAFYKAGKQVLIPVFDQRHGHPVIFAASCRAELLRLSADAGPRAFIAAHPELVAYHPVPHSGVLRDIDTPADLQP